MGRRVYLISTDQIVPGPGNGAVLPAVERVTAEVRRSQAGTGLLSHSNNRGLFGPQERRVNTSPCFLLVLIISTGQIFSVPGFQHWVC